MNYIEKLKEKCGNDEKIYMLMKQVLTSLLEFGYISKRQLKRQEKKLYKNIDAILIGSDISIDYKTGYYDAVKKELYIKDLNDLEAVYLRILYILTTTEISTNKFLVGYSSTFLSSSDYKIMHENFGINRAIISNLVCRLLYTTPTALSIMPTYRTYENDFLGNKIQSDNNIYFLEGTLLRELCYISNTSEENLYLNLFINPKRYLDKFLKQSKIENPTELLILLDEISRDYSHYNKLIYLNKLLNTNYLNIKKNILNDSANEFRLEQNKIKLAIKNALLSMSSKENEKDYEEFDVDGSLAEEINKLEERILSIISNIQNNFIDILINSSANYASINYAVKLKELDKILLIKNDTLKDEIYKTISTKLLHYFEDTSSNLIDKMKYSLVNEILSSDKYIKIYKNMSFHKLNNLNLPHDTEIMAITVDNSFMQLVKVKNLNLNMKDLNENTESIKLDNLGYLLSNPASTKDISKIETLFSNIRNEFSEFNNVQIENMFMCMINNITLIIVVQNNTFNIIKINENNSIKNDINGDSKKQKKYCKLELSNAYNIFNLKNTNLPVLYNKKETRVEKILSFFFNFS